MRYGFRSVLAFSVKAIDAVACRLSHVASSSWLGESGSGGGISGFGFRVGDSMVALGGSFCRLMGESGVGCGLSVSVGGFGLPETS